MARTPRAWPSRRATPTSGGTWSPSTPTSRAASSNRYQNWEVVDPEKWVPDGYACVRVDSRGAGRSPGLLDPFSPREARDLYECIEWAAGQPWSTGKVGLNGISYYAMNHWHVAGAAAAAPGRDLRLGGRRGLLPRRHPPRRHPVHVLAQLVRQAGHRGPARDGDAARAARSPASRWPGRRPCTEAELAAARVPFGEQIARAPAGRRVLPATGPRDWDRITVPLLTAANWGGQGLHTRGNFEGFTRAASAQKWLEVHGLEHWTHFYTDYGVDLQKRFFACFLHGDDAAAGGISLRSSCRSARSTVSSSVPSEEWPLARTRWSGSTCGRRRSRLDTAPPDADERRVVPRRTADGVTFTAPPLEAETEITGPVAARLFVSSTVAGRRPVPACCGCSRRTARRSPSPARSTRTPRSPRAGCGCPTASSIRA